MLNESVWKETKSFYISLFIPSILRSLLVKQRAADRATVTGEANLLLTPPLTAFPATPSKLQY